MLRRIPHIALLVIILISSGLSGCDTTFQKTSAGRSPAISANQEGAAPADDVALPSPTLTATSMPVSPTASAAAATAAPVATQAPPAVQAVEEKNLKAVGPDDFPADVNPLTGLKVANPDNLSLPPALISITNFPVTARPQAGLSFSPFVFEMYIGEGMSRFLALFYGDFPSEKDLAKPAAASPNQAAVTVDYTIGPVRSGRLPYESLRMEYGGFLVMASAWSGVASHLSDYTNVFGSDTSDVNSAMIKVTDLEKIAQSNQKRLAGKSALNAYRFDPNPPTGGKNGGMIWLPYSFQNQIIWRYDAASGAYARFQDDADGTTFIQAKDRLTGQNLAYSNVVVLFAKHNVKKETLVDIDLLYQNPQKALIFRDGKMYEVYWTTQNGDYERTTGHLRPIRFVDAQGNPFPLKPGQTWVELVPQFTRFYETVDSTAYYDLTHKETPGSGNWAIRFYAPKE